MHTSIVHWIGRKWNFGWSRPSGTCRSAINTWKVFAVLAMAALAGCSVHPLVDDVSPFPTEAIVAAARCELRLGLVEMVDVWFRDEEPPVTGFDPETIADHLKEMKRRFPNVDLTNDWNEYMDIAVAYDWSFDITETNHADSILDFKLPFVPSGGVDVAPSGSVTAAREGKRTFKNQDKFGTLLTQTWKNFCSDIDRSYGSFPNAPAPGYPFEPRPKNLLYPVTGSIGLREAVKSFSRVAVQEGGLDTFTDELTFTTTVDGKIGGGVTLSPVPKQFRLVSAGVNLEGMRVDLNKVKVSIAFPKARETQQPKKQIASDASKKPDVKGGYQLNANWRAAYALCVVDARSREDEFKELRLDPPEVTCLNSTDAFFPRGNGTTTSLLTGSRQDFQEDKRRLEDRANSGSPAGPSDRIRPSGSGPPDNLGRSGAPSPPAQAK